MVVLNTKLRTGVLSMVGHMFKAEFFSLMETDVKKPDYSDYMRL